MNLSIHFCTWVYFRTWVNVYPNTRENLHKIGPPGQPQLHFIFPHVALFMYAFSYING